MIKVFYLGVAAVAFAFLAFPVSGNEKNGIDKKYYDFADKLVKTINSGNGAFFDNSIDFDFFIKRITRRVKLSSKITNDGKELLAKEFKPGEKFTRKGMKFKLLKIEKEGKNLFAYFRILLTSGEVNYYKILLIDDKNTVKIGDMFAFKTGEYISLSTARNVLPGLMKKDSILKGEQIPIQSEFMNSQAAVFQINKFLESGRFMDALNIYRTLPRKLREDKLIMLLRLKASMALGVDSQECKDAMKDIKKLYPGEPALDHLLLGIYFKKGDYKKANECLDRISEKLGCNDPYIDYMHSICFLSLQKYEQAESYALKTVKNEPELTAVYPVLIQIALDTKNWKNVCNYLDLIKKNLKLQLNNLEKVPRYSEFVKTQEYRDWKKKN